MKFQREKVRNCFMEAQALVREHWAEVATSKDAIKLAPDWHKFIAMEEHGVIELVTARSDEGKLVGYIVYLVTAALHYRHDRFAYADAIFVSKVARAPRVALRMVKFAEEVLTNDVGCSKIQYHMKHDHAAGHALLKHLGYKPADIIFEKTVKRAAVAEAA